MNWIQFESRWPEMRGHVRSKWGRLTEDDLRQIAGKGLKKEALIGTVQERYGMLRTEAEEHLDEWLTRIMPWALATNLTKN